MEKLIEVTVLAKDDAKFTLSKQIAMVPEVGSVELGMKGNIGKGVLHE